MNIEITKGITFRLPNEGEKYGIDNLIAVARLSAKTARLAADAAGDGRLDIWEAFRIFRFLRDAIPAARRLDFKAMKNEILDLSALEVKKLVEAISREIRPEGGPIGGEMDMLNDFLDLLDNLSGFFEAAKKAGF